MSDSNTPKIVVGALIGVLGCGGLCVCAGVLGIGGFAATQGDYEVAVETARQEGEAAGRVGTTDACIRTGYDRGVVCGYGLDCGNAVDGYIRACLRAVPSPDPSICVGAPAPSIMGDEAYDLRICGSRGWEINTAGCNVVIQALETHCAVP